MTQMHNNHGILQVMPQVIYKIFPVNFSLIVELYSYVLKSALHKIDHLIINTGSDFAVIDIYI